MRTQQKFEPRVDAEFHFRNFFVDLLHEVDDEVDQLVSVHLLRVEVGDQETGNQLKDDEKRDAMEKTNQLNSALTKLTLSRFELYLTR